MLIISYRARHRELSIINVIRVIRSSGAVSIRLNMQAGQILPMRPGRRGEIFFRLKILNDHNVFAEGLPEFTQIV